MFSVVGDRPVLDAKRLRRLVGTFSAAGMHFIEGGHVARRTGGVWGAETFELPLTGRQATSPPGNIDLASICRQLLTEIDRNGWRSRWIQHVADEPRGDNGRDYRILVGMVRKYMPHLPIMDATMDVGLAGSVDIWCPQGQEHWKHRRFFDAYRALGDQVWFYTCCVPGGPCLNRLLDMELLRPVLLGWYAALCDLDGFLHWGLNHGRDPFNHSIVQAGADKFYPAGDSHVVYPGDGGPWSSLRLEAQREGLEDFELLKALRSRNAKAAGTMVRKVIRGFSNYTRNVATFRAVRRALLKRVSS
jgi:hypothetical protein